MLGGLIAASPRPTAEPTGRSCRPSPCWATAEAARAWAGQHARASRPSPALPPRRADPLRPGARLAAACRRQRPPPSRGPRRPRTPRPGSARPPAAAAATPARAAQQREPFLAAALQHQGVAGHGRAPTDGAGARRARARAVSRAPRGVARARGTTRASPIHASASAPSAAALQGASASAAPALPDEQRAQRRERRRVVAAARAARRRTIALRLVGLALARAASRPGSSRVRRSSAVVCSTAMRSCRSDSSSRPMSRSSLP